MNTIQIPITKLNKYINTDFNIDNLKDNLNQNSNFLKDSDNQILQLVYLEMANFNENNITTIDLNHTGTNNITHGLVHYITAALLGYKQIYIKTANNELENLNFNKIYDKLTITDANKIKQIDKQFIETQKQIINLETTNIQQSTDLFSTLQKFWDNTTQIDPQEAYINTLIETININKSAYSSVEKIGVDIIKNQQYINEVTINQIYNHLTPTLFVDYFLPLSTKLTPENQSFLFPKIVESLNSLDSSHMISHCEFLNIYKNQPNIISDYINNSNNILKWVEYTNEQTRYKKLPQLNLFFEILSKTQLANKDKADRIIYAITQQSEDSYYITDTISKSIKTLDLKNDNELYLETIISFVEYLTSTTRNKPKNDYNSYPKDFFNFISQESNDLKFFDNQKIKEFLLSNISNFQSENFFKLINWLKYDTEEKIIDFIKDNQEHFQKFITFDKKFTFTYEFKNFCKHNNITLSINAKNLFEKLDKIALIEQSNKSFTEDFLIQYLKTGQDEDFKKFYVLSDIDFHKKLFFSNVKDGDIPELRIKYQHLMDPTSYFYHNDYILRNSNTYTEVTNKGKSLLKHLDSIEDVTKFLSSTRIHNTLSRGYNTDYSLSINHFYNHLPTKLKNNHNLIIHLVTYEKLSLNLIPDFMNNNKHIIIKNISRLQEIYSDKKSNNNRYSNSALETELHNKIQKIVDNIPTSYFNDIPFVKSLLQFDVKHPIINSLYQEIKTMKEDFDFDKFIEIKKLNMNLDNNKPILLQAHKKNKI